MKTYLNNLINEKSGIDMETIIEVDGPSGCNMIPLGSLVAIILQAPKSEQTAIRTMLVRIDFANGSVMNYFTHLAQAIAI